MSVTFENSFDIV